MSSYSQMRTMTVDKRHPGDSTGHSRQRVEDKDRKAGMITVGIIGGVASGKSTIAKRLEELGAFVFDGDRIGHEVLALPEVVSAAQRRWGEEVVAADGQLDRSAIARRVFGDDPQAVEELKFWESETHPRITQRVADALKSIEEKTPNKIVVLDAAVLLKAGWQSLCDQIIFVDTPHKTRLARALDRGWTAEHFAAREASQVSVKEKREIASVLIDNAGDLDQTYEQVLEFWHGLSR